MTAPMERIQVLDSIEKDIITCLHSAGEFYALFQRQNSSSLFLLQAKPSSSSVRRSRA